MIDSRCRRLMGSWWVRAAVGGCVPQIPVMNLEPLFFTADQLRHRAIDIHLSNLS